jgi:protein FAM161A
MDKVWASKKKTTTPRPFSMSLREANRTPRKSKVVTELEQREEEKRRAEELECQKKFKAMPLPAHIHLRLFDELNEERESRRRYILQHRQELLKTMQTPFQFTQREEALKQNQSLSRSWDDKRQSRSRFRAKPYPAKIFDDSVVEKIHEEEEYRKIRNKMRAKELLRSSSLPPTMRSRGQDYVDGRQRQRLYAERSKKAGITVEHKFKPKINHKIPDFDKMYDNFMRDLTERKNYQKEPTVCQPFNLRTSTETFKKSRASLKNGDEYSDANDSFNQSQKSFRSTMPLTKSFAGA